MITLIRRITQSQNRRQKAREEKRKPIASSGMISTLNYENNLDNPVVVHFRANYPEIKGRKTSLHPLCIAQKADDIPYLSKRLFLGEVYLAGNSSTLPLVGTYFPRHSDEHCKMDSPTIELYSLPDPKLSMAHELNFQDTRKFLINLCGSQSPRIFPESQELADILDGIKSEARVSYQFSKKTGLEWAGKGKHYLGNTSSYHEFDMILTEQEHFKYWI
jgi:hypothetical protein